MIKSLKFLWVFCFALVVFGSVNAQPHKNAFDMKKAPKFWTDTIQSRYDKFTKADDFLVYHKTSRMSDRNTEVPILVQLFKGRLYHFMIFADPSTTKVEMKLGKRGVGHFITDKFYPKRDGEFYTDFTHICSKTGYYLLTVFQKGGKRKQLTHIAVLQKERDKNRQLEFGY